MTIKKLYNHEKKFEIVFDWRHVDLDMKNPGTDLTFRQRILESAIESFFSFEEKMNFTEEKAATHFLYRDPLVLESLSGKASTALDEKRQQVLASLAAIRTFSENMRNGTYLSVDKEVFTDIICIGIGGSQLGIRMLDTATDTIVPAEDIKFKLHFVSNVDPAVIAQVVSKVDPARTFVMTASKSYTTFETKMNTEIVLNVLYEKYIRMHRECKGECANRECKESKNDCTCCCECCGCKSKECSAVSKCCQKCVCGKDSKCQENCTCNTVCCCEKPQEKGQSCSVCKCEKASAADKRLFFKRQFGVSTNKHSYAVNEGYDKKYIFDIQEEIGGRFSTWTSVGAPIAVKVGFSYFKELLEGGSEMDVHVKTTKNIQDNVAAMGAYFESIKAEEIDNRCITVYSSALERFPSYLQQVEMESLGKNYFQNNQLPRETGMIIWGGVGTDVQHSFFQLLHQGTRNTIVEFILPVLQPKNYVNVGKNRHHGEGAPDVFGNKDYGLQETLVTNCLAQLKALRDGCNDTTIFDGGSEECYRFFGGKNCILILMRSLDMYHIGALMSYYEHKVYLFAVLKNINAFDQFGVELGKKLFTSMYDDTADTLKEIANGSSIEALINSTNKDKGF